MFYLGQSWPYNLSIMLGGNSSPGYRVLYSRNRWSFFFFFFTALKSFQFQVIKIIAVWKKKKKNFLRALKNQPTYHCFALWIRPFFFRDVQYIIGFQDFWYLQFSPISLWANFPSLTFRNRGSINLCPSRKTESLRLLQSFFFVRSGMKKRQMAPTVTVCNMAFTFREKEKNFRVCYQDRR